MVQSFIKKYFSIVFIVATLLGVLHYHHDLKQHNDCQVCTISSELLNADTPTANIYFSELQSYSEPIVTLLRTIVTIQLNSTFNGRAPPKFS